MKRLLFIASIMTVISGCAYEYEPNTYLRYSNISALEQAVSDDDIESMKMWLREMPGYTKISDHQAIETAYERVSQKIYLDLVDEDSGASYLIDSFDRHCRSQINRVCSDSRRDDVRYRKQMSDMEAASERHKYEQDRLHALKSGQARIESIRDARLLLEPSDGTHLQANPRINGGDQSYYEFEAPITSRRGSLYIAWWPDAGFWRLRAGAVLIDPEFFVEPAYNQFVRVIGRYIRNEELVLSGGGVVVVPVFDDVMVF